MINVKVLLTTRYRGVICYVFFCLTVTQLIESRGFSGSLPLMFCHVVFYVRPYMIAGV